MDVRAPDQLDRLGEIRCAALGRSARDCREALGGEVKRLWYLGGERVFASHGTLGGAISERRLGGSSGEKESAVVDYRLVLPVAAHGG